MCLAPGVDQIIAMTRIRDVKRRRPVLVLKAEQVSRVDSGVYAAGFYGNWLTVAHFPLVILSLFFLIFFFGKQFILVT